jgi:predicted nicotinamide N-methyase
MMPPANTVDAPDWAAFIAANTRVLTPPLVPEIRLHLAAEALAIWQKTEEELAAINLPPPFWAFAWAGGQALARYILDRPALVAGKAVLDLGAGSGLSAIAAARAGAALVVAADIDAIALVAIGLNAALNGVAVRATSEDLLADPAAHPCDVLLIADLFYERALAERVLAFADRAQAQGALVLCGDPQRSYFPVGRFAQVATYEVAVSRDLEDREIRRTAVWQLQVP